MFRLYVNSTIDYLRVLIVIVTLALEAIAAYTGQTMPWFLTGSIMIVALSLVNFIEHRKNSQSDWTKYALLLFVAMILCSIGDFLMAGVIYITPEPLINGVLLFGLGHVVYLFAMRSRSPLLFSKTEEGRRLKKNNLVIWFASILVLLLLFFTTLYNPTMLVISIGLLGYGILLMTVLAFTITKWFDDVPRIFPVLLIVGFCLFLFSDWLIGVHNLTEPSFLTGPWVGLTYIIGQILIHLSPWLGSRGTP
ncbi:MAG: lysoplasmalogenase family protein [Candidatus Thorarchaeota archaeon]|nr:lysoplasmalogenase family protein [Candidatus Thorarchaeota archaeon]